MATTYISCSSFCNVTSTSGTVSRFIQGVNVNGTPGMSPIRNSATRSRGNQGPDMTISTRKKAAFSIGIALITALTCVGLTEVVLRSSYAGIEHITGVTEWRPGQWLDTTYHWDAYHASYGWTNVPNYSNDDRIPFDITINSQGLRSDHDYSLARPDGIQRVCFLGDSCTFGEEVNDDETVPFHLENLLEDVEGLNFGVHGYGLGQMVMRLEDEVFQFNPTHVVLIYLTFDIARDTQPEFVHAKPVFWLNEGELAVANVPVPEKSRQPWLVRQSFTAAWLWGRPTLPTPDQMPEYEDLLNALLQKAKRICDRHEVPLTVVHIVDGPTVRSALSNRSTMYALSRLRNRVATSPGIDVLDLVEELAERSANSSEYEAPNGHWNSTGNRFIARRIAEHLLVAHPDWQLTD